VQLYFWRATSKRTGCVLRGEYRYIYIHIYIYIYIYIHIHIHIHIHIYIYIYIYVYNKNTRTPPSIPRWRRSLIREHAPSARERPMRIRLASHGSRKRYTLMAGTLVRSNPGSKQLDETHDASHKHLALLVRLRIRQAALAARVSADWMPHRAFHPSILDTRASLEPRRGFGLWNPPFAECGGGG